MNLQDHPLKPLADELMGYCQKEMGFQKPPSLFFQEDPENAKDTLGKTAYYDPSNLKIVIYTTGRHDKDILRSIAHELVHHMQNLRGEFDDPESTDPGYAQNNPHLRNMEKEAYLLGNMLFRDWEDQKKSQNLKENKIMNKDQLKEMIRGYLTDILNEKQFANSDELDGDKDGKPKWADPDDPANKSGKKDDSSDDDKPKKKAKKPQKGEVPEQLKAHVKGKQDKKDDKEQVDEAGVVRPKDATAIPVTVPLGAVAGGIAAIPKAIKKFGKSVGDGIGLVDDKNLEEENLEEGPMGDAIKKGLVGTAKFGGNVLDVAGGAVKGAALGAYELGKGVAQGAKTGYDSLKTPTRESSELEESDEIEEQSKTDMPDRVAGRDAGGRRLNEDEIEEGSCGSYSRDDEVSEAKNPHFDPFRQETLATDKEREAVDKENAKQEKADRKKRSLKEDETITTPEQENALYEARFSNRNEKLFKKLIGKWVK